MQHNGFIHIYCGDGKGKTTAAMGLALRCAGYGEQVLILQFLKGMDSGELHALTRLPEVTVLRAQMSTHFSHQMDAEEMRNTFERHNYILRLAQERLRHGAVRMLVLDEVLGAWDCNLVDRRLVTELLQNKPEDVEIILTGRNPPPALADLADYISRIDKVRHPYDKGIGARRLIEF